MQETYGLTLTSAPASEPLTLAEAKAQCRVDADFTDDDTLITSLITAARMLCEKQLGQALVTQTWRLSLDHFPGVFFGGGPLPGPGAAPYGRYPQYPGAYPLWPWLGNGLEIRLPLPPLQSVTTIQYRASDGTLTTLAPSLYDVDTDSKPGRVMPSFGNVWPATRLQANAVQVTFVAGYGAASAVPQPIKQAMLLLIGSWYENREAVITGTIATQLPFAVQALLDSQWHGTY